MDADKVYNKKISYTLRWMQTKPKIKTFLWSKMDADQR